MKGFNWIVNYYHNTNKYYNNIELTWYYKYNRSPLLKDIIHHANVKLLNIKMKNTFDIKHQNVSNSYLTPLEHYIYVTPFDITNNNTILEQLIKGIGYLPLDKLNIIAKFIKNHQKYYYNLNRDFKNEKAIDCYGSIFLSKCQLVFMDNYINIINFINDFRKYV